MLILENFLLMHLLEDGIKFHPDRVGLFHQNT